MRASGRGVRPVIRRFFAVRAHRTAAAQLTVLLAVMTLMPSISLAEQANSNSPAKLTLYKTADSAACSDDVAVWVDLDTRAYYLKDERSFGKTKHGGYTCRKQADAAGYRALKSR
jgi:hypothetical protein